MLVTSKGRERWSRLIAELDESGLSLAEFARRHDLKRGSLSHWKWKLSHPECRRDYRRRARKRRAQPPAAAPAAPLQFLEIRSTPTAERFELELTDGRRLRIPSGFEAPALQRLLGVLEVRP